jgi:hypothetical protein
MVSVVVDVVSQRMSMGMSMGVNHARDRGYCTVFQNFKLRPAVPARLARLRRRTLATPTKERAQEFVHGAVLLSVDRRHDGSHYRSEK